MEIKEGNKLIAEFLGKKRKYESSEDVFNASLQYHKSWDWLMPVVEKIEIVSGKNTEITFWQGKQRCIILDYDNVNDLEKIGETKIEATYLAVIEFINWYNNHLTPPL